METNKYKASRLNDLKNQINNYFEQIGQGRIYDDVINIASPKINSSNIATALGGAIGGAML